MNTIGPKANRFDVSERLLLGWEEIYRKSHPPLMALRLVESEVELLRAVRAHDPQLVDGLLDRYEWVAERLRGASKINEVATRLEISERALERWERMTADTSVRRLNARLMEREAATLKTMREHDPTRVDALVRRYQVLASDLRMPRRNPRSR